MSFLIQHFLALLFSTQVDSAMPWLANLALVNLLVGSNSTSTCGPLANLDLTKWLLAQSISTVCQIVSPWAGQALTQGVPYGALHQTDGRVRNVQTIIQTRLFLVMILNARV